MNLKIYCCLLVVFFATYSSLFSQNTAVGIGTTDPRMKLEVAGDALLRSGVRIGVIDNLKDDDTSTFLVQEGNARIKSLDVSNPTGAALGYIQVYEIYNPNEDWVLDFDTKVNATDFVLISLLFRSPDITLEAYFLEFSSSRLILFSK